MLQKIQILSRLQNSLKNCIQKSQERLRICVHNQQHQKNVFYLKNKLFYAMGVKQNARDENEKVFQNEGEFDHRVIGRVQKLFTIHRLSPGSPIFLPHGTMIYQRLIKFMRKEQRKRGYQEIITPNLYNQELWDISGHYEKYKEHIYMINDEKNKEQQIGLKPMNCPGHCLVYAMQQHSYRDLPIRYCDFAVLHRNEVHGSLTGLTRVRKFVQDDAHIFCTHQQIQGEITSVLELVQTVYQILGFQYSISLSTRPTNYLGNDQMWQNAEQQLINALCIKILNHYFKKKEIRKLEYKINEGDGAFYGPKIDFHLKDHQGRSHQCGTIQLDFNLPEKFQLKYKINHELNEEVFNQPVLIHRAILGSVERMIAVLSEHLKGRWPFWLSPRQILVLNVCAQSKSYAEEIYQKLFDNEYNVEIDTSDNTLSKKIKMGQDLKFNYILILGEEEVKLQQISVRDRDNIKAQQKITIDEFMNIISKKNDPYHK